MSRYCTCGRKVYFDERIGSYLHVQVFVRPGDWHEVDLAPSEAQALHPSRSAA